MSETKPDYSHITKHALEQIVQNTEAMHARSLWRALFIANIHQERFVNWILAALGAGIALIIANLKDVVTVIDPAAVRVALDLSVLTIIFGVLVKYYALSIREIVAFRRYAEKYIKPERESAEGYYKGVLDDSKNYGIDLPPDQQPKIDFGRLADKFLAPMPAWMPVHLRERFKQGFLSGVSDPLKSDRRLVRALLLQRLAVGLIVILLIAIISILTANIGSA